MPALLAEVTRSGFVESLHHGSVVGLLPSGAVGVSAGAVEDPVLPRSCMKPFQALACLSAGAPLSGPALAIAAGSHTGENRHVELVMQVLGGLPLGLLRCPPSWPEDEETRQRLTEPSRVRMNCSGKHAAMLAACVAARWPTQTYLDTSHPLQRLVVRTVEELSEESVVHTAIDGCGAPVHALSLHGLARAMQGLMRTPVADAMRRFPEYVGGTGHVNTVVMQQLPGVVAKGGAEGVLVLGTAAGHAVAVKVLDGNPRATTAIGLTALAATGFDVSPAKESLSVPVLGGGQVVGEVRVVF
ncbi:asparaginase [Lentzea sp. NEAU-D7]|uniref:asparaginase n=1 Tax=Lentzea sp. NEAU-D7 TaxID=2994667 RepID=UPI00224A75F8|nr:asparaginase [Lentzea sp. NEAU-D7]MCX2949781.1 asparaginase [Lentzea sp. NEAU-D7]MCX2951091.1 asparaginase [Lentzea sp. NEAU-D7]